VSLKPLEVEGVAIDWKAWRMPSEAAPPPKPEGYGEQAKQALTRILSETGLIIQSPSHKRDTFLAQVGAKIAKENNLFDGYHRRVFEAVWKYDQNIEDPTTLSTIAKEAGLDPYKFQQALKEGQYREMVEADYACADECKIWTIPSYMGKQGTIQVHHFEDIPSQEELHKIL
jgi:predicted DsbA family dithiol-disulfide isomerase